MRLHRFLEGAKSSEKPLHDENPRLTIYVADQSIWPRLAILTMSIPYCGLPLKCPPLAGLRRRQPHIAAGICIVQPNGLVFVRPDIKPVCAPVASGL